MTKEQAQKVLDELQEVRPEKLNNEAKEIFEAIMKIADERDELKNKVIEKDNRIKQLENMNKFQSKDIKEAVDYTFELNKEIEEKDKIIQNMSKYILSLDIDKDICMKNTTNTELCNEDNSNCVECIIKHFSN